MLTIGQIIQEKQPEVFNMLLDQYNIEFALVPEEELTPFQKFLDKLMRQVPRMGRSV